MNEVESQMTRPTAPSGAAPPARAMARFARDCAGSTAMEYCLIASLVVIAMIAGLIAFTDETDGMWTFVRNSIVGAISG